MTKLIELPNNLWKNRHCRRLERKMNTEADFHPDQEFCNLQAHFFWCFTIENKTRLKRWWKKRGSFLMNCIRTYFSVHFKHVSENTCIRRQGCSRNFYFDCILEFVCSGISDVKIFLVLYERKGKSMNIWRIVFFANNILDKWKKQWAYVNRNCKDLFSNIFGYWSMLASNRNDLSETFVKKSRIVS